MELLTQLVAFLPGSQKGNLYFNDSRCRGRGCNGQSPPPPTMLVCKTETITLDRVYIPTTWRARAAYVFVPLRPDQ